MVKLKIEYVQGTNLAICDGYKFRKDKRSGYWYSGTLREFLHRYVYEKCYGKIPDNYEIHHIDKNKDNNNVSNLKLLSCEEHRQLHSRELTETQRNNLRKNLNDNARPKAIEWHKSKEGSEWHKQHYDKMKDKLYVEKEHVCKECGKKYKSVNANNLFCSPSCRSKNRRKSGIDNEKRICKNCGKTFEVNKYYKSETCSKHCAMIIRWKNKK
jgi:predicted nucleic acid-binding Zn ribbon protein